MILTEEDVASLKNLIKACKLVGVEQVVIYEKLARGIAMGQGMIFSPSNISLGADIEMGIGDIGSLEKRLSLFSGAIEADLVERNGRNKIGKLSVKGKSAKVEYRCADGQSIRYPIKVTDEVSGKLVLSNEELGIVSKSVRAIGAEQLAIQVKKDGTVRIEARSLTNDLFEIQIEESAEFENDSMSCVNYYDTSSSGIILKVFDYFISNINTDKVSFTLMKSNRLAFSAYGYEVFLIPKINLGV